MLDPVLLPWLVAACTMSFIAAFVLFYYGWHPLRTWVASQEESLDRVLCRELLLDIQPRTALLILCTGVLCIALLAYACLGLAAAVIASGLSLFIPNFFLRHLIEKRRAQLNAQLPDGLTTLSSGVRAGLNLVQAMQLLARNARGPLEQEFAQILREYEMGLDLNQSMRNASNRIGSPLYRLTFTAIEMHRIRGGDSGESMDRIAESVREIQRLEGKLDAVTSQSRTQAALLTFMPIAILLIMGFIAPDQTHDLFTSGPGKITLLVATGAILVARRWIYRIMQLDI